MTRYRELLAALPQYRIGEQGQLQEWAWPGLEDGYDRRRLSHDSRMRTWSPRT